MEWLAASAERPADIPNGDSRPRRVAMVWNLSATLVIWLTSLVVLALWVRGAGIQSLFAFNADALTTLGRLCGLLSANLLMYQVLLMARVPVFERGFGRDSIVRMHRLVGFWSFWLMVAHIVLVVAGYSAQAGLNPLVQLWEFVWDYPGMLLAAAGTLLLVMVVLTSMRRTHRRLRYESWHLLHLYGYIGAGLVLPHMLWTGADFTSSAVASAYWWGLWGATAGCVLLFRLLLPVLQSLRHSLQVSAVTADGSRGVIVRMRGRSLRRLRAKPGQFFVWRFLDGPGWTRGHPFSLAAAPVGDEYRISVRRVGDGTDRIASMRPGTRVLFEGPYGTLTGTRRSRSKLLMFGAGAGVAPLVALLQAEPYPPGSAVLVTRDRDERERLLADEIAQLVTHRGLVHYELLGPRSHGSSPWLPASHAAWTGPELIRYFCSGVADIDVFVCGPGDWMQSVRVDVRSAGVPADRVHLESFTFGKDW